MGHMRHYHNLNAIMLIPSAYNHMDTIQPIEFGTIGFKKSLSACPVSRFFFMFGRGLPIYPHKLARLDPLLILGGKAREGSEGASSLVFPRGVVPTRLGNGR